MSWPHIENLIDTLTNVTPPQTRYSLKRHVDSKLTEEPPKKKSKALPLETPIPTLFVGGMSMEQIWEQLDLRGKRVCEHLQVLEGEEEDEEDGGPEEEDSDIDDEESELEESEEDKEEEDSFQGEEQVAVLREETSEEDDDDDDDDDDEPDRSMFDIIRTKPAKSKTSKRSEVDDDFFDLQEFNAETEQAEAKSVSKGRLHHDSSSEDSEDDKADIDLFDAVDDAEDEEDMSGGMCLW